MKSETQPLVRRCLAIDARKISKLTDKEFLIARQELGVWGIPVEQIDEARRAMGLAPLASPLDESIALAVAEIEPKSRCRNA